MGKNNKKRFKYNKDVKLDDNANQIHTLVTIMFVTVACVFIGIQIISNSGVVITSNDTEYMSKEQLEMAKAFTDNESVQVAIKFKRITTTEDEYERLREACNIYMEQDLADNKTKVETDIKVEEDTFVDGNIEDSEKLKNKDNSNLSEHTMHETGPIYFQDKLLLRYINEKGEMQVVASALSSPIETNGVVTYGKNELYNIFKTDRLDNVLGDNGDILNVTIGENTITEQNYINDITNLFIEALQTNNENMSSSFKKQALKYFTYDGYDNILNSKDSIKLSDKSILEVTSAEAGKSNTELFNKDRIFIQLKIVNDSSEVYTNIVVKLDKNFKVFDIDIL